MIQIRVSLSVCRLCKADCGIKVHVNDAGVVLKVEGDPKSPLNRGGLCSKGLAARQLIYDPDRISRPMRRHPARGWEAVSWDSALDEIATTLERIRRRYGGTALATYEGASFTRLNTQAYFRRFLHYFGSPNRTGTESLCVGPKYVAAQGTYGKGMIPTGDFGEAGGIFLFGTNPAHTAIHRYLRVMDDILAAQRRGAPLVVVDPLFSDTAAKADLWVPIKPATDLALVLAMIWVMLKEGLYDREFVAKHTVGFENLAAAVVDYTPQWASAVTTVPAAEIVKLTRLYAACRPAVIDRREGCMHGRQATQTNRAMLILAALGGNVDRPGGFVFNPDLPLNQTVFAREKVPPGADYFAREFGFPWGDVAGLLPEAILREKPYPIKALIVTAGNPVMAWPNTAKVRRALQQLELLVVTDLYETETAQLAHFLLPGTTFLERTDLCMNNLMPPSLIRLAQKVIEPPGEARSEWWVMNELGRRLYGDEFTYASEEAFLSELLQGSGYTFGELEQSPRGFIYRDKTRGKYLRDGFPTPSGRIELEAGMFKEAGFDPLPRYKEPEEAGDFPYYLVSGARQPMYTHSTLMNLPWLNDLETGHRVEIADAIACAQGLKNGDLAVITTEQASVTLPVKIMPAAWPGLVLIRHGFGHTGGGQLARDKQGVNVNLLTDDLAMDPLSGAPAYREMRCRVEKVKPGGEQKGDCHAQT